MVIFSIIIIIVNLFCFGLKIVPSEKTLWLINTKAQKIRENNRKKLTKLESTNK